MSIMLIINLVILASVVGYFAYRLGHNPWIFFGISIILSPIVGSLLLAIWDYYKNFIKGNR
ncbi:hypothetical protein FE773_06675 [Caminibacter mediatlanticus TB-2]|uniref:Uncharacterized protein n=1 Tax=Caminibacter mediatlanticus TB-2 TaxID=391592 RepID=A0ABX5VA76_9BACT|nr:hypothetical protein [Caminibacter mediatlanticus]QCT94879.1 hypothetical protein FE773_06675 [Caminibacter mediatlanticus TB-2]